MIYLGDIPRINATRLPASEAVAFEGVRLDWTQLNTRINRLANGLGDLGFARGDHVAVLCENCLEYLEIYYALAKAGLVTVPLNSRLSPRELSHIIDHSEAAGLVVGERFQELVASLRPGLRNMRDYISVEAAAEGMVFYDDIIAAGDPGEPDWEPLDENDMVILMYTGGTTGLPKGVMLSHRNMLTALIGVALSQRAMMLPGLRTLFALPFFHIANWQPFFWQMMGGSVVISRSADAAAIVRLIVEEMPVFVNLVPTVYQSMLELPGIEDVNFNHVAAFSVSGAPMAPEVMKRCMQVFGLKVRKGYGLTETASAVTSLSSDEFAAEGDEKMVRRGLSVGKETINVRVKVRGEDGSECGAGEVGEITVYGKNVMLGYWKDPEQTARALRNGWLWTGDIGYKDEEGYVFLVDRKQDMIITGGENVYPTEVEDVLYRHEAVSEAAVIGVSDPRWGEAVKAVVVLKPGTQVDGEELIAFCRNQIAGYKCPKSVAFVSELPKSTVGKILRKALRDRYGAAVE
ncbi:MAG: long-chain-fatty-acid--CoA ligase [Actinobacteria bacterium]|jgi:acyl-CoA synthetase (AMP-forming)/AMP-acid ligase II|nr:MAG: long-chain-fatty-acid--CoA ligase [Actinomycetota bacterium]